MDKETPTDFTTRTFGIAIKGMPWAFAPGCEKEMLELAKTFVDFAAESQRNQLELSQRQFGELMSLIGTMQGNAMKASREITQLAFPENSSPEKLGDIKMFDGLFDDIESLAAMRQRHAYELIEADTEQKRRFVEMLGSIADKQKCDDGKEAEAACEDKPSDATEEAKPETEKTETKKDGAAEKKARRSEAAKKAAATRKANAAKKAQKAE